MVAGPLEIGEQVGRKHNGDLALGCGSHQGLEELSSGKRIEARDRLVEEE